MDGKSLRVRQVNLLDNTINLPSGGTKNGKPRTIVMTQEVRALVVASIEGKQPDAFAFNHEDGSQVKDFRAAWKKMFKDAGVEMRSCTTCGGAQCETRSAAEWTGTL